MNSKRKGTGGERELAKILAEKTCYPVQRNLDQTRDGGTDLYVGPFSVEIKRAKRVTEAMIAMWWEQARERAKAGIPVLAFRADRESWRIRFPVCCLSREMNLSFNDTAEVSVNVFVHVLELEARKEQLIKQQEEIVNNRSYSLPAGYDL